MRSLSIAHTFAQRCAHREDHPSRDIHPITSWLDLSAFTYFGLVYIQLANPSTGQQIYFAALLTLYAASFCYHGYHWHWFTRFLDQSCIGLYIIASPLPFLPQTWWTWTYALSLAVFCLANKWYNWEKRQRTSSLIFLGFGILSMSLLYTIGLPTNGMTRTGHEAMVVLLVVALFVLKLWIFQSDRGHFLPGYWGNAETCHTLLLVPMYLMTSLVVSVPAL